MFPVDECMAVLDSINIRGNHYLWQLEAWPLSTPLDRTAEINV